MKFKIKEDIFDFNELDFLIVVSFLIRCKKEYERYINENFQKVFKLYSHKPALAAATLSTDDVKINIQGKNYIFNEQYFFEYVDNVYELINSHYNLSAMDYRIFDAVY